MLQAAELDLDTCWCVNFPNTALERALELPETERSVLLMPLGYGDEKGGPGPKHTQRKPLGETIRRL
jgi:nitroreductase